MDLVITSERSLSKHLLTSRHILLVVEIRNQSDLPEWHFEKGESIEEYAVKSATFVAKG